MREHSGKLLFNYWNRLRRGRTAPQRFEIEPKQIAPLLPETFILECADLEGYRFRLAGTRICEQFGRELRGTDLIDLWDDTSDRIGLLGLLHQVTRNAVAGYALFEIFTSEGQKARFGLSLLPLVHEGENVNRVLGAITALDAPWWLGAVPAARFALTSIATLRPDDVHASFPPGRSQTERAEDNVIGFRIKPRLRVLEGGRTEPVA